MRSCCVAVLLFCTSCLDFGKFELGTSGGGGQGGGNVGGDNLGGDNVGGEGASTPGGGGEGGGPMVCPSDPPRATCVIPATGFDGKEIPAWTQFPFDQLTRSDCPDNDQSDCSLTVKVKPPDRNDLRSDEASKVEDCSASIRIEAADVDAWTFLELAPDGRDDQEPDLGQRAEVAVRPGLVRFKVGSGADQEIELPSGAVVDGLRIQVRREGLALEALAGSSVVGCFLADRPDGFDEAVRIGVGVDARDEEDNSTRRSTFDDYGFVP